jgi:hypothetical protein
MPWPPSQCNAGLQTNAKWWHILALSGVKIDPRAFQSSDPIQRDLCVRAVVPELLERSSMDLELTIDYCRQFDVEPEFATLCYVERIMVQVPKGVYTGSFLACNETVWARQVRKATANIEEKTLLRTLRALLPRIHPLDYEKIRFMSTWIVTLLEEEVEMVSEGEGADLEGSLFVCGWAGGVLCGYLSYYCRKRAWVCVLLLLLKLSRIACFVITINIISSASHCSVTSFLSQPWYWLSIR